MRHFFLIAIIMATVLFPIQSKAAQDIRKTPVPDSNKTATYFGYSSEDTKSMLNLTKKELWAKIPPNKGAWTNTTYALKYRMLDAGIDDPLANVIINACKVYARDPRHCVIFASSVACAESSCGSKYDTTTYSIFGVRDGLLSAYLSRTNAVIDWVKRYNGTTSTNGWYVANEGAFYGYCKYPSPGNPNKPSQKYLAYCDKLGTDYDTKFFYSEKPGVYPASEYCLSEESSGSKDSCPNGYKNSQSAYYKIK